MPGLADAVTQVKRFQSRRFAGSYVRMLASGPYRDATRFFLDELYSDRDTFRRQVVTHFRGCLSAKEEKKTRRSFFFFVSSSNARANGIEDG